MKKHLCSTDFCNREYEFSSIDEILTHLKRYSSIPHKEFESVKLFCNYDLMRDILAYILANETDLDVVSIDMTNPKADMVVKDYFSLALTDDNLVYIQNAYNGDNLYNFDAKYVLFF